mmetsp:Transcript_5308/g.10891  ORF Transcript_5308/g.10891 Transcript_5308/m.10891 type:complete len:193 (+) Transcript_5308:690-1268(+)
MQDSRPKNSLAGRRVLLGITGSVAAIRAEALFNALRSEDAEVRVIATVSALPFLGDFRDRALTDEQEWKGWTKIGDPILHIELRKWADILVIAPLSANTLAKVAQGMCDNLLTSVVRAWPLREKPWLVAPAMNTFMWDHPLTRQHLAILAKELHADIVDPQSKVLACGDSGMGAMESVDTIVTRVARIAGND